MEIQQGVQLRPHNSLGVAAVAANFANLTDLQQLPQLLAWGESRQLPVLLLGEGSNVLFVDDFPGLVIKMVVRGMAWDSARKRVTVAAGENWHEVVTQCMQRGFHGIENLALIPGSAGAAPVQNIGAYGVELEQFVDSVEVFDRHQHKSRWLSREQCEFAYRDSLFKREQGAGLIITRLCLQFGEWEPVISYQGLEEALAGHPLTPQRLYDAVCQIRLSKLPDPAQLGNAGSFFKNPVVSKAKHGELIKEYPKLPHYPTADPNQVKLSAAWLLDTLGWKGRQRGAAAVHQQHALVLVNSEGKATGKDIVQLAQEMRSSVLQHFDIDLQPEVRII